MSNAQHHAPSSTHRDVRLPTRTLGRYTGSGHGQRSMGGMWHSEKEAVTLLLFPDHGDDCRALVTLDADAAEALADDLRQLAKWTRDYAASKAVST